MIDVQEVTGRMQSQVPVALSMASALDAVKEVVFGMLGTAVDAQQVGGCRHFR